MTLRVCLALILVTAAQGQPAGAAEALGAPKADHHPAHSPARHEGRTPSATARKPPAVVPKEPAAPPAPSAAAPTSDTPEPAKGSVTGLPLPRFAALKSDEVYLRVGPGTRYPIDWVYKRRDLPMEILREFENWRLVQDHDGVKGWVHQATLTGRRAVLVVGEAQTVRADANDTASPVAHVQPGVVGRLRGCEAHAAWCQVQFGDLRGWLKRTGFWGIEPDEAVQ